MNTLADIDANAVFERLRAAVGAENDNQLANKTGVPQTTISTWRKKNVVPFELCAKVASLYNKSMDHLIFGDGEAASIKITELSPIELELFKLCWMKAEKVVQSIKGLDTRDVCLQIYNDSIDSLKSAKDGKKLTLDQLLLFHHMSDTIYPPDYQKLAKVIESRLVARRGAGLFSKYEDKD